MRLFNVTIVEHSPGALRIKRRGKEHVVPYTDVISVQESGRFQGGTATISSTHSRYVTVTLNRRFPFGSAFSFYTKKEYGDFEGLSGPAKLIEKYAAAAKQQLSEQGSDGDA